MPLEGLYASKCAHCEGTAIWYEGAIIYPEKSTAPLPNADMNEDIRRDYLEARSILEKSPRGAAALLRLCVQKLRDQLGEGGKSLNDAIASLVKKGLPRKIQQALDSVRVIGNNAVHPGQLDLRDDRRIALTLFGLVNVIAQVMITQPKEIEELYHSLPESALEQIQRRDAGASPNSARVVRSA